MTNVALFVLAAVLEIAGCFAFWVWMRRGGGDAPGAQGARRAHTGSM